MNRYVPATCYEQAITKILGDKLGLLLKVSLCSCEERLSEKYAGPGIRLKDFKIHFLEEMLAVPNLEEEI